MQDAIVDTIVSRIHRVHGWLLDATGSLSEAAFSQRVGAKALQHAGIFGISAGGLIEYRRVCPVPLIQTIISQIRITAFGSKRR